MSIVSLENQSSLPKYRQIVISIENAIAKGLLNRGDKLPSLNAIKNKHKVSRDTVLTAFNDLKSRGIITSVVGKGYYVSTERVKVSKKIFLLFDEFNAFKEDLYNSFIETLGDAIQVDLFFHHFNKEVFDNLIDNNLGNYTSYVIMPANLADIKQSILQLPSDKVFILDQTDGSLKEYSAIYQNFEEDIQKGLFKALHAIRKYKRLILVKSSNKQPEGIVNGFKKFGEKYNIDIQIVNSIQENKILFGDVFVTLEDVDLIKVIKEVKKQELTITKDIGIIAFNDTLLKEVVENGITTISTDFKYMGKRLAQMILNNEKISIQNPSKLIFRKSI